MEIVSLSAVPEVGAVLIQYIEAGSPGRTMLVPGADATGWPQEVQEFCAATWTAKVVDAYQRAAEMPSPTIDERRAQAAVSRQEFCIALKRAGILPENEALDAAKGNWPATFDAALSALTSGELDATEAQIIWATSTVIHRAHPFISALGAAGGLSEAQIDALFGIAK